jgi:hypothetical protein
MLELLSRSVLDAFNEIAVGGQCLTDIKQFSYKKAPYGLPRETIAGLRGHAEILRAECERIGLSLSADTASDLVAWLDKALHAKPDDAFVEIGGEIYMRLTAYLDEVRNVLRREIGSRKVLVIDSSHGRLWAPSEPLFGPAVHKRFKAARGDIEMAGKRLALEQSTACVFHLMRAMEVAVRRLAKRVGMTVTPSTTWVVLTGGMDGKIKRMPEATKAQTRKKEAWGEAKAHLHEVGKLWRNKTMHPAKSYTPRQAEDLFNAVRVL